MVKDTVRFVHSYKTHPLKTTTCHLIAKEAESRYSWYPGNCSRAIPLKKVKNLQLLKKRQKILVWEKPIITKAVLVKDSGNKAFRLLI